MKNILKICSLKLALLFSFSCVSMTAYAEKHLIIDDEPLCMPVYDGGVNQFDGFSADQNDENSLAELERRVLNTREYVTPDDLTDSAFDTLLDSCKDENGMDNFWFESYLNPKNTFHSTYSQIYFYQPVLEAYMEALENDTLDYNPFLSIELDYSTVVIDYGIKYFHDRIGKDLSDEINGNIPEWFETGYLCIESPVSVKITLFLTEENNYYTFYVKKDEPFLVKIKQGGYNVVDVNSTETGDGEETLPFNDLIQITNINSTPENAYRLQLQQFVEKYNIQDIVIPDKSEHSPLDATFPIDMSVEKTTLETGEPESTEYHSSFALYLLGGIAVIFLILTVIFLIRKKSDTKQKEKLT